jgi:hypothetical protein
MTCYLDDDLDQDVLIRLAALRSHGLISPRALRDQLIALNHYR